MFYASLDTVDPALPVECRLVRDLIDPARPDIRFALIELSRSTNTLPERIVVTPKSGFDVTLRGDEDAVYVYAFASNGGEKGEYSLAKLWERGVKDWGVLTSTLTKAREYQVNP